MPYSCCCSLLDYQGPGQISIPCRLKKQPGGPASPLCSPGQIVLPCRLVKQSGGSAFAVAAVVIIAVVTPTAPSIARASTKNIVVFISENEF